MYLLVLANNHVTQLLILLCTVYLIYVYFTGMLCNGIVLEYNNGYTYIYINISLLFLFFWLYSLPNNY